MSVYIPPVRTFPNVEPSKAQAVKVLEEAAEVFAAWQDYDRTKSWGDDWDMCVSNNEAVESIVDECCDVITATCNLLAALGINDRGELMVELSGGRIEEVYAGEVSVRGVYGYV